MNDAPATLTFLGSGDAFSSGGRLNTCMHVDADGTRFLMDCGASALAGFKQFGIDTLDIDVILITHFHADHYGGLPLLLVESKLRRRTAPLPIAGPPGMREFFGDLLGSLLPGTPADFGFDVEFLEYSRDTATVVGPLSVRAWPVIHVPETIPHAIRVETGTRTIGYSGDTEWTDTLIDAARTTDLFVCEAVTLDRRIKNHVDYVTVLGRRPDLDCKTLVLTHMGPDVIAAEDRIRAEGAAIPAHDGFRIDF